MIIHLMFLADQTVHMVSSETDDGTGFGPALVIVLIMVFLAINAIETSNRSKK